MYNVTTGLNQTLLKLATARSRNELQKVAIVPAGQTAPQPMDPAAGGGGAPPMDPTGGGMPPAGGMPPGGGMPPAGGMPDPAMLQQMLQMVGGAGGAGGMAGKGGKKAEQAMLDAKLYKIMIMLVALFKHLGIAIPPEAALDAPPDPAASQAADQDHAMTNSVVSQSVGAAGAAGPDSGIQPMQPMDPSAGLAGGKQAAARMLGSGITKQATDLMAAGARRVVPLTLSDDPPLSPAARFRHLLGN